MGVAPPRCPVGAFSAPARPLAPRNAPAGVQATQRQNVFHLNSRLVCGATGRRT